MKSGKIEQGRAAIFNPRRLNSTASVDFCGACHRTWADVILADQKLRSVMNVRFQPYRLEDSKCWRNSAGDPRLACVACHNPHEQLNQTASSYDAKCLTCHSSASTAQNSAEKSAPKLCPQSKSNCITCHMPQVEVPTIHATFFDHRIRIPRPNSAYPL
jgi:hypothetical protein